MMMMLLKSDLKWRQDTRELDTMLVSPERVGDIGGGERSREGRLTERRREMDVDAHGLSKACSERASEEEDEEEKEEEQSISEQIDEVSAAPHAASFPTEQEIYEAIPATGIGIRPFLALFQGRVPRSRAREFFSILERLSLPGTRLLQPNPAGLNLTPSHGETVAADVTPGMDLLELLDSVCTEHGVQIV